jgi:mono/diheme cytochrome c family protein
MTFAKLAAALIIIAVSAGAISAAQEETAQRKRGQALLAEKCSLCHAIGATGRSLHRQAPPFRTVVRRYNPDALEEALAEGLVTGHPDMPEFVFAPDEIAAITAYLRTLRGRH